MNDLKFAIRQLLKNPAFTAVAVITLALGIGVSTSIFSLVNGLLLQPLPFADQNSLLLISEATQWNPRSSVAYPNFLDWHDRQHAFSSMGAFRSQDFNVTSGVEAERAKGAMVSHDFFPTLAVRPVQGRLFLPAEDAPGADRTVLIRESLWRRQFAGSSDVLDQQLALNGKSYAIVGVLPDSTVIPDNATEVWVPLGLWANDYRNRRQHPGLRVIGRLKPGETFNSARADLTTIAGQLEAEYPEDNGGSGVYLERLPDYVFKSIRPVMVVLSVAVACVLLIACANVANLLLVRGTKRQHEFAVRAALGAGRGRLLRLLIAESAVLGLMGAVGGVAVSFWLVEAIKSVLPAATPRLPTVGVDSTVLLFAVVIGIGTGVLVGLIPGWRASRPDLRGELARATRNSSIGRQRLRGWLITGEFALTVVLLVASGLMLRTLHRVYQADLGFASEHLLTFSYDLPSYAFPDRRSLVEADQQIVSRLAALPGVLNVGYSTALPITTHASFNGYTVEGSNEVPLPDLPMADTANVSPGYFAAMDIPLVRGRNFTDSDQPGRTRVAIIDTVMAERHFPGQDPIGRRLKIGDAASDLPWMEIVGVVQHIEKYGVRHLDRDVGPQLYRPAMQAPGGHSFTFAVRSAVATSSLIPAVRHVFHEFSPAVPVFDFQTMDERFAASIWSRRLTALLLGVFGFLASTLAMVGLYGVLAYAVSQRTREFGIRLVLGACPSSLLRQVTTHGLKLAATGIGIGLLGALAVTRLMRSLLYEVAPFDPLSFVGVTVIALAIGLLASFLPARRATRINPMEALHHE